MSLGDAFNKEVLERLAGLQLDDLKAVASAITLGYNPTGLHTALQAYHGGVDPELPKAAGQPRPIVVNAWSFVNDKAQHHGVFGVTPARASELKELLMSDRDKAVKEIEAIVSAHQQRKGSNKGVLVTLNGMPGDRQGAGASESSSLGSQLKREIDTNGSRYGRYKFEAKATPLGGPKAFSVPLGGGFSAFFANKRGAVDVARIARVRGRHYPLIAGYVGFYVPGNSAPLFGSQIPEKATWDCTLGPDEDFPPAPTSKAPTNIGKGETQQ